MPDHSGWTTLVDVILIHLVIVGVLIVLLFAMVLLGDWVNGRPNRKAMRQWRRSAGRHLACR